MLAAFWGLGTIYTFCWDLLQAGSGTRWRRDLEAFRCTHPERGNRARKGASSGLPCARERAACVLRDRIFIPEQNCLPSCARCPARLPRPPSDLPPQPGQSGFPSLLFRSRTYDHARLQIHLIQNPHLFSRCPQDGLCGKDSIVFF